MICFLNCHDYKLRFAFAYDIWIWQWHGFVFSSDDINGVNGVLLG